MSHGSLFYSEIAERLGRKAGAVRWKARKLGLPTGRSRPAAQSRMGQWNSIHAHLREEVLRYFLTHTPKETTERFGLSAKEFKSLMTTAYRQPGFKHLRKTTRDHSRWNAKQLKILLRYSGLRQRKWVAEKIGRGNVQSCIKERLNKLGVASRNLQGITLSQYRQAFDSEPRFYLQTDAGPIGVSGKWNRSTHWKIIPWVWLDKEIKAKRLGASEEFARLISARAMFQDWIFEGNALAKMKRICKELKQ